MSDIRYLNLSDIQLCHSIVLNISGGHPGTSNDGSLDSVCTHIQNDLYYPYFIDKLSHLIISIAKFHAFIDGNKRTALAAGAFFLLLNDYDPIVPLFLQEMENYILLIVKRSITEDDFKEKLAAIIWDIDATEDDKLTLINQLSASINHIH